MDCEITFLHECCTIRDLKVILIDLDEDLNCTIIGQLEPFTATSFHQAPPMILLRRVTKYSAGPGTWTWRVPEFYHIPTRKLLELKCQQQLLYFFNKIQYVRMKTLILNGMIEICDVGCENWNFDECDLKSNKIKEILDMHFAESEMPLTNKASSTSATDLTAPRTLIPSRKPNKNDIQTKAKESEIHEESVARPAENVTDGDVDVDSDEVISRKPGWKRKRTKFDIRSSLPSKKRTKFDILFSPKPNKIYKCKTFTGKGICGQKFSSWVQFDKHQNDHTTQCTDCYKICKTIKGLECHRKTCAERHKPKSRVYQCRICKKKFITETQFKSHDENVCIEQDRKRIRKLMKHNPDEFSKLYREAMEWGMKNQRKLVTNQPIDMKRLKMMETSDKEEV